MEWMAPGRARNLVGAGLLGAITLACFIPALSCGYVWDDDALLTDNHNIQDVGGLWRTWTDLKANNDYYPLVHTSFWIEYHLWQFRPLGYHLNNILLHIANAILVWLILRRLAVPGAWVAAALFAIHPVQVESVAWVAERKSVLGGLFCLLAVWSFLRVELAEGDLPRRRRLLFAASLACFLLAMLARPVTMAAAAVLPLLIWWKRGRLTRRDVRAVVPYFLLAVPIAAATVWVQHYYVRAQGAAFDYGIVDRGLIAGRALLFYAGELIWPYHLTFVNSRWAIDAGAWWQYLYPAGVLAALAALALLRRRLGTGPLVAALVFIVMLSPALGFFNVYWFRYYFVADHMQYLACIGLIALGVAAASSLAARLGERRRPATAAAAAVVVGVLGVLTWQQCGIYKDAETILEDTLKKDPASGFAHVNLGGLLSTRGEKEKAFNHFLDAVKFNPRDPEPHYSLGKAMEEAGRLDDAVREYREAIRCKSNYIFAINALGRVLTTQGRLDEAIGQYRDAIRIAPVYADAHFGLGKALAAQRRTDEAANEFREALRYRPDMSEAHYELGNALAATGHPEDAIRELRVAVHLNPDFASAHNNLGNFLADQRKFDEAILEFREAIRSQPDLAQAHYNLAFVLASLGRLDEAVPEFREAAQREPGSVQFHFSLGMALDQAGKTPEALAEFREAIRLQPDNMPAYLQLSRTMVAGGRTDEAIRVLTEALARQPKEAALLNELAWRKTIAANPALRNGAEAVRLAEQACALTQRKRPVCLGTLAAAYAEAGRFSEAITTAQEAITLAVSQRNSGEAATIESQLKLYEAGRTCAMELAERKPAPQK